jgi:hypothetical protein
LGLAQTNRVHCVARIALGQRLPKTNAGAATVFINEFDACCFEGSPDHIQSGSARATRFILQLMNGNGANSSSLGEILLAPAN